MSSFLSFHVHKRPIAYTLVSINSWSDNKWSSTRQKGWQSSEQNDSKATELMFAVLLTAENNFQWRLLLFLGGRSKNCEKRQIVMFVRSYVCPSAWKKSAHTGRIFVKFDIWWFFWSSVEIIQVPLKSEENNGYFTWRLVYIYNNISLSSSWNEKCFRKKLYRNSKHTFCVP